MRLPILLERSAGFICIICWWFPGREKAEGIEFGIGNAQGGMTQSRAEAELTKNRVSGTKINQTKSITTIGNIVVLPVCAINIPKVG